MLANTAPSFASVHPAILKVSNTDWNALNASVEGRLGVLRPLAEPCYLKYDPNGQTSFHTPDLEACQIALKNRRNVEFISSQPAAYHDAFYGSCMTAGHGCPLANLPANDTTNPLPGTCYQGSVPDYYIDVRSVRDIQAGLEFAEEHRIPLVIKNTGHDYKGRSAGRHSLAIWTHNLQPPIHLDKDFKPDGCGKSVGPTLTYGAGQGFEGIYEFAHQHGYMAIGGACPTVGASGGYVTGGGHSLLSPVHGLGVDNVMQMKVVLPNGTYVTANRCQNQEIFFALRGGGGASFGVVTETTARVFPEVPLQMAVISFASPLTSREVTALAVDNGVKWAEDGWGGYMSSLGESTSLMLAVTPKLTLEEAKLSMKPLIDFARPRNNGTLRFGVDVTTVESYWEFLQSPAMQFIGGLIDGISVAQSSRLVLKENFGTESKRQELTDVLSNMPYGINMVAPLGYELPESDQPGGPGEASVTPAWREAVWHIMLQSAWDTDSQKSHTPEFFVERFKEASELVSPLREITPNSGAYQNEADVYEPNHIDSFWGEKNYDRLLKIKKDVDPSNLITCHQCVGADSDDSRLGCYPQI
ncbi:isoamyl alcohol oxidase [Aspergillus campestris IBT 28561]|uniref:Isoamyl alcohol oxidase n=1 Tax=Aspergillus campestris (strain IBT 28561) TaxID=1392248 RepID=A0A2I1CY69_ASPC2|nr:isoamyl alcohol oxidase [Aspergillus campestris IBT 28561]PKY02580.1 isoamyl alcohol oxidase [Aspergillus campestris IBT 28561]